MLFDNGRLAQLDRASVSEAEGRRFDSCNAHQALVDSAVINLFQCFWLGTPMEQDKPHTPKKVAYYESLFVATVLVLFAATMFSLSSVFAKKNMAFGISPYQVSFIRLVIGLLCTLLLIAGGLPFKPQNKSSLFFRGILSSFGVIAFFLTVPKLPLGFATLLNYQSPLFTTLFCVWFLKESFRPQTVFALIFSSIGVFLLSIGTFKQNPGTHLNISNLQNLFYIGLGLASAAFSGAGTATMKALSKTEGAMEIFSAFCLVGSILTLPPALYYWITPNLNQWLYLILMGLTSAIGQICLTYALRSISAIYGSLLLQLSPVLTIGLSVWIYKENFSLLSQIGTLLTFAGVGLAIFQKPPKK